LLELENTLFNYRYGIPHSTFSQKKEEEEEEEENHLIYPNGDRLFVSCYMLEVASRRPASQLPVAFI